MPRFHRKSRAGCKQCRGRRVKCDERKPSCINCEKNGLQCSLEFLTPIRLLSCDEPVASHFHRVPKDTYRDKYMLPQRLGRQLPDQFFDGIIGELFHHYINVVAPSLDDNQTPSIWRFAMPQMAISYRFLLFGITAVSAMHLATLLPHRTKELQRLALVQENAALPSFRALIKTSTLESIHATFAFSGSVVYFIMALPENTGADREADRCRIPSPDDKYPHWFQAIRGLMTLLAHHRDQLARGPFAPMLSRGPVSGCTSHIPDVARLAKLDAMFRHGIPSQLKMAIAPAYSNSSSSPADTLPLDIKNSGVYLQALWLLRRVFELAYPPNQILSSEASLRVWPGSISQSFVELIYQRDPRALVILAHYCILLKRNDHAWYIRDLGRGLLENITQSLGKEWQHWIQWPMAEIFP